MLIERTFTLIIKTSGNKQEIKVGIGEPYFPAKALGLEEFAGCQVHTGTMDAGQHEVYGVDKLQALCNGLTSIDFFLKAMANQGDLFWPNGNMYNPKLEAPFPSTVSEVFDATLGVKREGDKGGTAL